MPSKTNTTTVKKYKGLYKYKGEYVFPFYTTAQTIYLIRLCPIVKHKADANSDMIHSQNGFIIKKSSLDSYGEHITRIPSEIRELYQLRRKQARTARPISCPKGCKCYK